MKLSLAFYSEVKSTPKSVNNYLFLYRLMANISLSVVSLIEILTDGWHDLKISWTTLESL